MEMIIACQTCGLIQNTAKLESGSILECSRCSSTIATRKTNSIARTAAFSLAALILYIPANIYPILRMNYYGAYSENTVWDGCVNLFKDGQWFVAGIVFLASILIPLCKLAALFFLVVMTKLKSHRARRQRVWIYKAITVLGPWAMLDVFLLSILVALVKLQQIATILPGRGFLAFTMMVLLTLLASSSFDPRLIWDEKDEAS
jgi:paraquat-inducible protein A